MKLLVFAVTWLRRLPAAFTTLFAVCMLLVPQTGVLSTVRGARATLALHAAQDDLPARQIAREIRSISPDARRMAVWGWMPSFYVETGIPPATRHAVCIFVIEPSPAREHLRASFLSDIRREKPDVIVDAVADGCFRWNWDSSKRLQSFPELAQYVRQNYVLAAERSFGTQDPVRLYVSNEYLSRKSRP